MTEAIHQKRHTFPTEPPQEPNAADDFARWAGDHLLGAPAETLTEAVDTPPALGEVDAIEVLEKLHPGRAARLAAEQVRQNNAARFGEWAAGQFTASDQTPEAQSLAAYLNRPRTN